MMNPRQIMSRLLHPVVPEENMVAVPATLTEVLERHELIDVVYDGPGSTPVVIVAENPPPTGFELVQRNSSIRLDDATGTVDMRELGAMGTSIYYNLMRQDYNPEMRAPQAFKIYDQMRRSDASVRSSLRAIKTPILAARWFIQPVTQKDGKIRPKDQMMADFIWKNLTEWMTISWEQVLLESLLQLDFGFYMFEKVYTFKTWKGQERLIWQKLAPRHPMDVVKWEYDGNGGPAAAWMYDPDAAEGVPIPIDKLLVFTFDKEAGDMGGISVLRSAYMHWYYKNNLYKIDAIQKERHGIGVPIIKLPMGYKPEDKTLAHEMGRNLRTNERAHVVLPPNWTLEFAQLGGNPVDAILSIEHHDKMILSNVLGEFLKGTSNSKEAADLFMKSVRFAVENIRGVFNKYCIPQLINYNWPNIEEYPVLRARRVGDTLDWRAISFAIRNFVGAGILVPDDGLEEWVRDEMDMPAVDPDTVRQIIGNPPQAAQVGNQPNPTGTGVDVPKPPTPAAPGLPRQSTAGNMRQQARGTGKSNTGQDGSGG